MFRPSRLAVLFLALIAPVTQAQTPGPFPELQKAVDQFDRAKLPAHPRMVLTPAEMTRVRTAALSDWGKPYWQLVRFYVDDGRKMEPPADPPGYPDGKWNVTDWRRIVSVGDEYQSRILAAAFAAVVTQDPADIAEAKRWTLAAARLDPLGMTGMKNGVDHPARDIPHAMALSYDWLYDHYTPDERTLVRDSLKERGRGLYEYLKPFRGDSWNNHPWFQTSGMVDAALAIADEVPEADAWWRYGSHLYLTEFLPKGGQDGDWHEGTHYVSYTLLFVYQWADALKTATGIDPYSIPWLQKVGRFMLYISPPAGAGIQFNDNNFTPPNLLDKYCAYQSARATGSPVFQWYGDQIPLRPGEYNPRHAISILIAHDAAIHPTPPGAELPLGVFYRDSGWAVMRTDLSRSDDLQFALKGGKWYGSKKSRGHDHPDQNGFLLNYNLQPLAVDSGYYDYYNSPHHNNWTFTGKAHNTLLVDGQEQLVGKDGQIVSFASDREGFDFVESEAAGAYPEGLLKSWRRQVLFVRPDVFLIRDVVQPTKPATISWLLHAPTQFRIDGQKLKVTGNDAVLVAEMLHPPDLKLNQSGGFPPNAQPERKATGQYPDQWHLSMTTPSPVDATRFDFVMRAGKPDVTAPLLAKEASFPGAESYGLTIDGERHAMVWFFDDEKPREFSGFSMAARVFAQRNLDHSLSTLSSQVTHLAQTGQILWKSDRPADISGVRDDTGWKRLSVRLDSPTTVRLAWLHNLPLRLNGTEVKAVYDAETKTISLSLPAGSHILTAP